MFHGTFIPSRSTWISPCHWTSIHPVSQTPAAQPALQERTLCFPMIPSQMNRVSPNTHLSLPMVDLKGADTIASTWHLQALCAYESNVCVLMGECTCVCICVCMHARMHFSSSRAGGGGPLGKLSVNCGYCINELWRLHCESPNPSPANHLLQATFIAVPWHLWERHLQETCAWVFPLSASA